MGQAKPKFNVFRAIFNAGLSVIQWFLNVLIFSTLVILVGIVLVLMALATKCHELKHNRFWIKKQSRSLRSRKTPKK